MDEQVIDIIAGIIIASRQHCANGRRPEINLYTGEVTCANRDSSDPTYDYIDGYDVSHHSHHSSHHARSAGLPCNALPPGLEHASGETPDEQEAEG